MAGLPAWPGEGDDGRRELQGTVCRAQTGTEGGQALVQARSICSARTATSAAPARAEGAEALAKWRVVAVVISETCNRVFSWSKTRATGAAC